LVALYGASQQSTCPDDLLLSDKLFQGARSHASGEGCFPLDLFLSGVGEKISHS
jgi:hypothetical protein